MPGAGGFWSYVHADDEADGGRVVQLAHDVVAQFEMLTGEKVELFLDRDSLEWGDRWRVVVDSSLSTVAFFIPIVTPRYFLSAECRRELQFFARRALELGVRELVMPLLYVDFPALHEEKPSDDLIVLVKEFQWENWTELRFADLASSDYRLGVAKLAQKLVSANARAESAGTIEAAQPLGVEGDRNEEEEEPGILDRIGAAEEAIPRWTEDLESIGEQIKGITSLVESAGERLERANEQGQRTSVKLAIVRSLADNLSEPAKAIIALGNDFVSQLYQVDSGVRAIIDEAPSYVEQNPNSLNEVCRFFGLVRDLRQTTHEALGGLEEMMKSMQAAERISRDLRPRLRSLRQGLVVMLEAREVMDGWVRLIDESSVRCVGS